jgi:hypothetical protein
MFKDPVCNMMFDEKNTKFVSESSGRREEEAAGKHSHCYLPSHLQSTVAVALKLENVKKVFDSPSA